jgi:AhpD family alkylhydroperoxidase
VLLRTIDAADSTRRRGPDRRRVMDTEHIHIDKQSPAAYRSLVGVSTAVAKTARDAGLSRSLVELVNVRVSQVNGCPSCLEVHHRRAVAAGVTDKQ